MTGEQVAKIVTDMPHQSDWQERKTEPAHFLLEWLTGEMRIEPGYEQEQSYCQPYH
jgi:hypothetical protein